MEFKVKMSFIILCCSLNLNLVFINGITVKRNFTVPFNLSSIEYTRSSSYNLCVLYCRSFPSCKMVITHEDTENSAIKCWLSDVWVEAKKLIREAGFNSIYVDSFFQLIGSHFYGISEQKKSWFEAREFCRVLGGELLTMETDQKRDETNELLATKKISGIWLGLFRKTLGDKINWHPQKGVEIAFDEDEGIRIVQVHLNHRCFNYKYETRIWLITNMERCKAELSYVCQKM